MNNPASHHTKVQIPQKAGSPPKSKAPLLSSNKRRLPPTRPEYVGDPPLRAAGGDDDLMSEGPWVDERG